MSKNEIFFKRLFYKNNLKFECEKTFSDLRGGKYRFDFYFENLNGKRVVVEINGEQHYYHIKHFHKTRQEFLQSCERDRRKISWCLANNIIIYCIPYWEIENIKTIQDLFQNKFIAKDKWKNDTDWRKFSASS